jgi:Bacterial SH3 domain
MNRVSGFSFFALLPAVFGAVSIVSCGSRPAVPPTEGVAYVGPLTLNLRKDLASKSPPAGEAKHGDRVDILETRRRFVRVRTGQGLEGWTDSTFLLSSQQMDELRQLADDAAKLPSIGAATTYDALNMHTAPSRQSPSFFQIPEGAPVEVVGHRATPRVQPAAPPPAPRRPAPTKKSKAKESKQAALSLPPAPRPLPPQDWQEISRPTMKDFPDYTPPVAPPAPALDDWNLVRTRDGKAGWVLARMLFMAIPDDVAQYAEGHRITSYFALGDVKDGDQVKRNWLWTTIGKGTEAGEFDSFRVFVWSTRRHRYETAYIERNVTGYFPVALEPNSSESEQAFSLVLQDKDGKLYKRTYAFSGYRIRMTGKTPFERPPETPVARASTGFVSSPAQEPASGGWWAKVTALPQRWLHR